MTELFVEHLITEIVYLMILTSLAINIGDYQEQEESVIPEFDMPKKELIINCMFIKAINIKIEQLNGSINFLSDEEKINLKEEVLKSNKALRNIFSCSDETKFNIKDRIEKRFIEILLKTGELNERVERRKQREKAY